jgi:hypothetical protein
MRKRVHNWVERTFGRKTIVSLGVMGGLGELLKSGLVPFLDPTQSPDWSLVGVWLALIGLFAVLATYWRDIAHAAAETGDNATQVFNLEE